MAGVQGLIYGPIEVYTAPEGTDRPDIGGTPPGGWTLLGRNGQLAYGDAGVTVSAPQTIETTQALGTTAPTEARRTEEGFSVQVVLQDSDINNQALLHNNAAITAQAAASGVAGSSRFNVHRGSDVHKMALLCKGSRSPNSDNANHDIMYWCPRVYVDSVGEPNFSKGVVVMREITFMGLYDTTHGLGTCEVQTDDRG